MANIQVHKPNAVLATAEFEQLCKTDAKSAAERYANLAKMNTAALPDTVFVRRGKDGIVQKVATRMLLAESRKEVLRLKKVKKVEDENGQWSDQVTWSNDITAAGYRALNQTAGLHVITPDCVVVGGQRQPNPYIVEDPRSHTPSKVYARKVVIGPSRDTGNLVATDIMVVLDLNLYLLENLIAKLDSKWTKSPETLGVHGDSSDECKPKGPEGSVWKFFAVTGDIGVWFNLKHPDFKRILKEHVQRCKFADRIAQTVAERNAIKAHPGMPSANAEVSPGVIAVSVVGWSANISHQHLEQMREMVNQGGLESGDIGMGQKVEVRKAEVSAEDEADIKEADAVVAAEASEEGEAAGETDEQEAAPEPAPEPAASKKAEVKPAASAKSAERAKLLEAARASYEDLVGSKGIKEAKAFLDQIGVKSIDTATDDQLKQLKDQIPF